MTAAPVNGVDRAQALRLYFDIQLRFAEHLGTLRGMQLPDRVVRYTNLHGRFGLGRPPEHPGAEWRGYIGRMEACGSHDERLQVTVETFAACPVERMNHRFGCFHYNPPDATGMVRIHFFNLDQDRSSSPLAAEKAGHRRTELTELVTELVTRHPDARTIRGTSWLYNTDAYRRLFPADYVASRTPAGASLHFSGSSSWGQFLDFRGNVKEAAANDFLDRIPTLDADAPWRCFPLQALRVEAPVAAFVAHFLG